MTEGKLTGKTALITGAGQGIGRAIAAAFASEGANVMCADINLANAKAVADSINGAACECDVSVNTNAQQAVAETIQAFGGLHIVVCGAAVFTPIANIADLAEGRLAAGISG